MTNWIFPPQVNIPLDLLAWTKNDLLARLLVQRGITTVQAAQAFINADDYEPASPTDLPDIPQAVTILNEAITQQVPICVWGDFDVDGQTSTALLVSILRDLGGSVSYYIPNRLTEGHGLALDKLSEILQSGVGLILTCDTGIEAHQAVQVVHQAGAKIIITDHHDLGETLPPAEAVINPKRLPSTHPLRELPGVGVAYKLAQALAHHKKQADLVEPLLDLVALGIVADVATQTSDTRYLLQQGLAVLRQTQRVGLLALIAITNLKQENLTAEHIGFWLGPRLNALGRLGDANQAVELLTTTDKGRSRILAAQLDALNERRKLLVDRTVIQALSQLTDTPSLAEYNGIVLAANDWHPGVIGIACSRLVEQFNRPVILLSLRDGLARGSARSVAGCDIHQAIKTQAHLLESFGGHPMAAGLALSPHNLGEFRQGLSRALQSCVAQIKKELFVDAVITLPALTVELLNTLQKLAPFGPGNLPITLVVKNLAIQKATIFGRSRTHRRVTVADEVGHTAQVIWWNSADEALPEGQFDLALHISRHDYRVKEAIQLTWVAIQQKEAHIPKIQRQIVDLRQQPDRQFLFADSDAVFWRSTSYTGIKRLTSLDDEGCVAKKLVIWQAPPGQDVLLETIAALQPTTIYLVAEPSQLDTLAVFMHHLMGIIKYALNHYSGHLEIATIATVMCHREATVRLGLDWLINRGKLRTIAKTDERWVVRANNASDAVGSDDLEIALRALLDETAAYRAFVQSASLAALGL